MKSIQPRNTGYIDSNNSTGVWFYIGISILEFILAFIIILDCNSVYRAMDININPRVVAMLIGNICTYLLILLFVLKDRKNYVIILEHKYLFLLSVLFVLVFNALNVVNSTGTCFFGYFLFFMNGLVVLLKIYRQNGSPFKLVFTLKNAVLFLAVVSTILWFGSSILELWGKSEDVYVDWGGEYANTNYLNLCIRRWFTKYKNDATKNLGIFLEPPMFGLFLGFGLYTELFLKKKSNLIIVCIFLTAIASNRATLTMMISLVALFFKYIEVIKDKKHFKKFLILSVLVVIGGVVALLLYKKNQSWKSFAVHLDDIAAALKCWVHYPILGCGYNTEGPIKEYMSEFRKFSPWLSNSAAVVLAEGGIVLFTYYFLPFAMMFSAFFKKNRNLAYWGFGMFFFLVVVIFHTRLLVFLFMALGYAMVEIKKSDETQRGKKRYTVKINYYMENVPDKKRVFYNKVNIPVGFTAMMGVIVVFCSVFGILCNIIREEPAFSIANSTVSGLILVLEVLILGYNKKHYKFSSKSNFFAQLIIWVLYMMIGQPYRVIDCFLTIFGLRIQDRWWSSIIFVVILYVIGVLIDALVTIICVNKTKSIDSIGE